MGFVEWIVETYKSFGTKLEFITDRSQEGNQFCKGFGGIGGLMRYKVEFSLMRAMKMCRTAMMTLCEHTRLVHVPHPCAQGKRLLQRRAIAEDVDDNNGVFVNVGVADADRN